MKSLLIVVLVFLTSFTNKPFYDAPIRTNYMVGTNIYKKVSKEKLNRLTALFLKDKEILFKSNQILAANKLGKDICYGVWDDDSSWCNGLRENNNYCRVAPSKKRKNSDFSKIWLSL